ncbi:MAG: dTDP-4-dehydrorhamnose 3,5-epimerase [Hyphomicrobiales bacterium]|nr:dTDP-4-dehydrorhamnose 3,5-epimerase [Hyphomicrobiales bacterium]
MSAAPRLLETPAVLGGTELVAKQSAVNEQGALRNAAIEGVLFRPTRPVPHEDGYVAEVARANWDMIGGAIVQVHITTTFPGRVRAWGLHQRSTDRLFVVDGLVQIVVFDGRDGSATFGRLNVFTVSPKNPGLLVIEPNLYHGWKNIGTNEAIIINMPTSMYDHEAPDALDLPWDSEAARRIIPHRW